MNYRYWKIEYMPSTSSPGVFQWVFKGSEEDLEKHLQENHMCKCESCISLGYTNFFDSPSSAEYFVTELQEEDL